MNTPFQTHHFDFILSGRLDLQTNPEFITAPSGQVTKVRDGKKTISTYARITATGQNATALKAFKIGENCDLQLDEIQFSPNGLEKSADYKVRGTLSLVLPGDVTPKVSAAGVLLPQGAITVEPEISGTKKYEASLTLLVPRPSEQGGLYITTYGSYTNELYLGDTTVSQSYVDAAKDAFDRLRLNTLIDLNNDDTAQQVSTEAINDFFYQLNTAAGRPFSVQVAHQPEDSDTTYEWATEVQYIGLT